MEQAERNRQSVGARLSGIIGIVLCVVLIPILVVNLTIIVQSFTHPDKVPGFMGYKPLIVLSGSMEPMIYPGDLVVVKEVPAESLVEGDVIAYLRGGTLISHRIMEIEDVDGERRFYTKGDNNNVGDDLAVTAGMLEGKYLFKISRLGNTAMFMQTPMGMVLFIAAPVLLFILYDVLRRRQYDVREAKVTGELEAELEAMRQKLAEAEAAAQKKS